MKALLESVRQKAKHSVSVKEEFFDANVEKIVDIAKAIAGVYIAGGKLLSMGKWRLQLRCRTRDGRI